MKRCRGAAARTAASRRLAALVLLGAGLVSGACGRHSRPGPAIDVTSTLVPAAAVVGPATLTVTLRDPSGTPVRGAAVTLEGHMSHAGMAPVLASATERAPGVYAMPFAFTMRGDWALLVSVILTDGSRLERRIDVANVRPAR
jgi:hypothetical protein